MLIRIINEECEDYIKDVTLIPENLKIIGIKDFYYPMETFVNISKEAGFTAELQNEWFEKKKSMIKLEKLDRIN